MGGCDLGWRRCEGVDIDRPSCSRARSLLISNQLLPRRHPMQFNMEAPPSHIFALQYITITNAVQYDVLWGGLSIISEMVQFHSAWGDTMSLKVSCIMYLQCLSCEQIL